MARKIEAALVVTELRLMFDEFLAVPSWWVAGYNGGG